MAYIHIKKPRLMQLSKTKDGFLKNPVKREGNSSKIYDAYIRAMEVKHSKHKKNFNQTGDPNKEKS